MRGVLHRPAGPVTGAQGRGERSFAAVTALAVGAVSTLAVVDPNRPGHYPTCPFLFLTGAWCPGCGSLRAVHDLAHGDLPGALARNPLTVLLVGYLVFVWSCWLARLTGRTAPHPTQLPAALVWSLLAVVVAFWVLRNVPGWTLLSPS